MNDGILRGGVGANYLKKKKCTWCNILENIFYANRKIVLNINMANIHSHYKEMLCFVSANNQTLIYAAKYFFFFHYFIIIFTDLPKLR